MLKVVFGVGTGTSILQNIAPILREPILVTKLFDGIPTNLNIRIRIRIIKIIPFFNRLVLFEPLVIVLFYCCSCRRTKVNREFVDGVDIEVKLAILCTPNYIRNQDL